MTSLHTFGLTAAAALLAGAASAATLTMDSNPQVGFLFSPFATNNSANCPTANDTCLLANNGAQTPVLTYSGGPFDLTGFSFRSVGNTSNSTLVVTANFADTTTASYSFGPSTYSVGTAYDIVLNLTNLNSLEFSHSGGGTSRVDDVVVAAAVPLPAAGLLLGTAIAGLGVLRRRRRAV